MILKRSLGPCKVDHFFKAFDSKDWGRSQRRLGAVKNGLTSRMPEMLEEEIEVLEFRKVDSVALPQKNSCSEDVLSCCVQLCRLRTVQPKHKPRDLREDEWSEASGSMELFGCIIESL